MILSFISDSQCFTQTIGKIWIHNGSVPNFAPQGLKI